VACADSHADVASSWAETHGCEASYGDYGAMIAEHDLDGVIVATWPNLHPEHVLDCLEAGVRNVLCEKSLALTGAEALEIWTAAREADALVVEAFMYRHHPTMLRMEALLADGEIGELDNVHAAFNLFDPGQSDPGDPLRDWRQWRERGGGVPHDLATYCVDACNWIAGAAPVRVAAVLDTNERYGTIDRLFGLVEYENGVVGMVESTKRSEFDHELRIGGSRGEIRLPVAWRPERDIDVVVRRSIAWGEFEDTRFPVPAANAYVLQLEAFVAAARGEREPKPLLAESVATAFTLDALLTSGAEREVVDIELPAEVAS
jgi:predicted dehydrogenase